MAWRKYPVAVNPMTHEVIAIELTKSNVHDCTVVPALLLTQKNLGKVYADGAYPYKQSLDAIAEAGGNSRDTSRSGTGLVKKNPTRGELLRNELVLDFRQSGGKRMWKKTSGYHKRSLAETHMFRLKTILGASLRRRRVHHYTGLLYGK